MNKNSTLKSLFKTNTAEETPAEKRVRPLIGDLPEAVPDQACASLSRYTDRNGDTAVIPSRFCVSGKEDEQTVCTGLVAIGPDGSEFVWIPTTVTPLARREFGAYFYRGDSLDNYDDETDLPEYREMIEGTEHYGGFWFGRYEASRGKNSVPVSKRVSEDEPGRIFTSFSPQNATLACKNIYKDSEDVQGFFPWGITFDTVLAWLIDSGNKTRADIVSDSTDWGNYSNSAFSHRADGRYTGIWKEASANNIYDLAGNNWEWTQERSGSAYVLRGGGYNLMGGGCAGYNYPVAIRDPLPGTGSHYNVTFRVALYLK